MTTTLSFNIDSPHWAVAHEAHPIEDDAGKLLGAFTVDVNATFKCFISSKGNPLALILTGGGTVYAKCILNNDGSVNKIVLHELQQLNSISVKHAEEV